MGDGEEFRQTLHLKFQWNPPGLTFTPPSNPISPSIDVKICQNLANNTIVVSLLVFLDTTCCSKQHHSSYYMITCLCCNDMTNNIICLILDGHWSSLQYNTLGYCFNVHQPCCNISVIHATCVVKSILFTFNSYHNSIFLRKHRLKVVMIYLKN